VLKDKDSAQKKKKKLPRKRFGIIDRLAKKKTLFK
jgi:hypothetical protein